MENLVITNIQRMCFHDGPGIRTTIFFKGCAIHCPWCSNPENVYQEGFSGKADTIFNKKRLVSIDEVWNELMKDMPYWADGGGVTLSGGEFLLQSKNIRPLLEKIKGEGVHIAAETSLFANINNLKEVVDLIDFFFVDIKIMIPDLCKKVLGGDINTFLVNVKYLYDLGKINYFRIPCCKEYTLLEENVELILKLLDIFRGIPIQIFKIHDLARNKYKKMGIDYWSHEEVSDDDIDELRNRLTENSHSVEVIKI